MVNIRTSDMVAIVGGRSGTLGELAIAYDEGKLIGILVGTGGITDLIRSILEACKKDTGARVIYDADPNRLVEEMLRLYRTEHYRKPSCFCDEHCACHDDHETSDTRARRGEPCVTARSHYVHERAAIPQALGRGCVVRFVGRKRSTSAQKRRRHT